MLKKIIVLNGIIMVALLAGCQNNQPAQQPPSQPTEQTVPEDSEDQYESNLQIGLKELDLVE